MWSMFNEWTNEPITDMERSDNIIKHWITENKVNQDVWNVST